MTLKLYAVLFLGLFSMGAKCQEVALKSNLLYDAFATLNAGVETGLADRWTLDVSVNYNGWTLSHDRKWKHWLLQPEARYWFCDRWAGHFVGAHLLGGQYNVGGLKTTSLFWEATSPNSPTGVTKDGSWAWARYTGIPGFWTSIGTWKPK